MQISSVQPNHYNTTSDLVLAQMNPIDYSDLVVLLITALYFEITRFDKKLIKNLYKIDSPTWFNR